MDARSAEINPTTVVWSQGTTVNESTSVGTTIELKIEPIQIGVAWEYLAAGELSLRGWVSSITLRNSRGIDIIASNPEGTTSISIQVKTNSDGVNKWILTKKAEEYYSENHIYIFVAIKGLGQRPEYRIVASERVARQMKEGHQNWLQGKRVMVNRGRIQISGTTMI